jgi:signal transduction histidine kinase
MPHPGLRGRVAVSLVLTAAVALAVAAFALLAPLERNLRTQEVRDLVAAAVQSRASFAEVETTNQHAATAELRRRVRRVAAITGARVALLDANRHVLASTDPDARDGFRDALPALATDRAVRRIVVNESSPQARVAVRVRINGRPSVLALRKPLTEQQSAVVQVRRAFGTAALAALAVALVAAGFFAATVGRRVRSLRDSVRQFGIGGKAEDLPDDKVSDEVGDLSRAFTDMARRLQREEEVRREFVATASHELRTPLMTLQGRLELLAEELQRPVPDIADGRRQLADARAQAARLGRLAADLLDLSRIDAEAPLRREDVELTELAEAVVSEFRDRGREIELEAEEAHVTADPSACARVIRILLDNAFRYSHPGAPVTVRVEAHSVSVIDCGPGVPGTDTQRIFERFARGSSANASGGFGLGLAIARELTQRMGGVLELTANAAEGASFTVRLPPAAVLPNAIPTRASSV